MQGIYVEPVRYEQTTTPTALVVSVAEVKACARLDSADTLLDSLIESYIKASTMRIEKYSGLTIRETNFKGYYDSFPAVMKIRKRPNTLITKIEYYSEDNVLTTLAGTEYMIQKEKYCSNIMASDDTDIGFPETKYKVDAVIVYVTCGWTALNIPEDVKESIKQLAVSMLTNCDMSVAIPEISKSMVSPYKNHFVVMEN